MSLSYLAIELPIRKVSRSLAAAFLVTLLASGCASSVVEEVADVLDTATAEAGAVKSAPQTAGFDASEFSADHSSRPQSLRHF